MSSSGSSRKSRIAYNKPPLTLTDQVQRLKSRNLTVTDENRAEFYLGRLNYYRFAAYCLPFEADHERFRDGAKFDDVLELYIFDRELRLLLLDALERLEVSLRTQLAYHLSHNHSTAHPHLKAELFADPIVYDRSLNRLARDVRRSKEEFIQHLTRRYDDLMPPIWAVVELMTLGQLSKWFSNIRQRKDRQAISRIYGLDEKVMTSFCEHLSLVRNHAAHHARLWNRRLTKTFSLPLRANNDLLHSLYPLPDNDRQGRKLYNTFVLLNDLMNTICDDNHWQPRLKKLINQHQIDVRSMGFPDDWQQRPLWQ